MIFLMTVVSFVQGEHWFDKVPVALFSVAASAKHHRRAGCVCLLCVLRISSSILCRVS